MNQIETIQTTTWMLDPSIIYLNHGSFGARPTEVFEAQQNYKREFESSPIDFLDRKRHLLESVRKVASDFLKCDAKGIGFVENATTGVGCVMRSLQLKKGSEILTTNHVYNGIRQLLIHHASMNDLQYRECNIQLPLLDNKSIIEAIDDAITPNTSLLVIDHVTSSTAIVFPIQQIVQICKDKGILVLVDGAHAPGMLDLNIGQIDADWYVANLHKWVCAPLGAAFVWTNQRHRKQTHPMTISHFLNQGYAREFDWQGTRDISPWLSVIDAINWGHQIGWDTIRAHNHKLAIWIHKEIASSWGVEPISPMDGSMLGSMVSLPLPPECPQNEVGCIELRDSLYAAEGIETCLFSFEGRGLIRFSAQLYVKKEHIVQFLSTFQLKR